MKKLHIGLVASRPKPTDNPFDDNYKIINNYIKAVARPYTAPSGIIFPDGKFDESYLEAYDGFVLQGGPKINPYHIGVIHYAYEHNKPLLGICLGCQAIGLYGNLRATANTSSPDLQTLLDYYRTHQDDDAFQLRPVAGHSPTTDYANAIFESTKHPVQLQPDSYLRQIFQTDTISVPSLHARALTSVSPDVVVNAVCRDVIEGVELINDNHFLLGTQFHPELSPEYHSLFDAFLSEVESRSARH